MFGRAWGGLCLCSSIPSLYRCRGVLASFPHLHGVVSPTRDTSWVPSVRCIGLLGPRLSPAQVGCPGSRVLAHKTAVKHLGQSTLVWERVVSWVSSSRGGCKASGKLLALVVVDLGKVMDSGFLGVLELWLLSCVQAQVYGLDAIHCCIWALVSVFPSPRSCLKELF